MAKKNDHLINIHIIEYVNQELKGHKQWLLNQVEQSNSELFFEVKKKGGSFIEKKGKKKVRIK